MVISTLVVTSSYTVTAKGTLQYPMFHKGMSYATWNKDSFSKPNSDESLKSMADNGITCVAIIPTWYQEESTSTKMSPADKTPSDSSVKHAIQKVHEYGMSVMLKPHIDLTDQPDSNRSDIGFQKEEDWSAWFKNYEKFITHYADMAQKENVEFFCVGTELSFASTRTSEWKEKIIPAVRKEFSGQLTYAANWDEYNKVEFWDSLDYAGIDAYFPLSNKTSPTIEDLKAGWNKWVREIQDWQNKIQKPVIFTECGYPSADTAAAKPWEEAVSGNANTKIQADCYKATFETVWNKQWFFGVYWWNWSTYAGAGGEANRGFTPQNKLALETIKAWYGKLTNPKIMLAQKDTEFEERMNLKEAQNTARSGGPKGKKISFTGELAGRPDQGLPLK